MPTTSNILFFINVISVIYCAFILISYVISAIISSQDVLKYHKESTHEDYESILSSTLAPSVSIIAPAYNESLSVVDCVRSFLTLRYINYKVIIVNDGSKDDTLEKLIKAYDFEQVDYPYTPTIETKPVRGIYTSKNPAYSKLVLVDKENGRKSDALNVGINVADTDYVLCIDVDSILEPDTILRMVKPIMVEPKKKVVAVGGIVWLTNDAVIEDGKLISVHAPRRFLNCFQVLEYMRTFLITRTIWVRINGLPIISGAIGLYERKIIKELDGFDIKTPGEDLEIVMRLHRAMQEKKEPYLISYVPDPLCWTEGPSSYKDLQTQRVRWSWSAFYAFNKHKKVELKSQYGVFGLLTYPYFFYSDTIAPMIELLGFVLIGILLGMGLLSISFVLLMLAFMYSFTILFSSYTLLIQELSYSIFKKPKDILKLVGTLLIEPFYYHPKVIKWALKGNWDFFFKKNIKWAGLTRVGLSAKTS
jgi:poly-beta-1,6-N-acetyl-D-glucosamine synthase